jgi:hypothetical protein
LIVLIGCPGDDNAGAECLEQFGMDETSTSQGNAKVVRFQRGLICAREGSATWS